MIKKQFLLLSTCAVLLTLPKIYGMEASIEESVEKMHLVESDRDYNLFNDDQAIIIQLLQDSDITQENTEQDTNVLQQIEISYKIIKLCTTLHAFIGTTNTVILFSEKNKDYFNYFLKLLPLLEIVAFDHLPQETKEQKLNQLVYDISEEQCIELLNAASYLNCQKLYDFFIAHIYSLIDTILFKSNQLSDQTKWLLGEKTTHAPLFKALQFAQKIEATDHYAQLFDFACAVASNKVEFNKVKSLQVLKAHKNWVRSISFSGDSEKVASSSWDKTVKIWDLTTEKCLFSLTGHDQWVNSVSFSADGKKVASGSDDTTVKIWDTETGNCLHTFSDHKGAVHSVSFSADGKKVVSGSSDKTVKIWDLTTEKCLTLAEHNSSVRSVSFAGDGKKVVAGSHDNTIKIWDAETGNCLLTLDGHNSWVTCVAFSKDNKKIASGSHDNTVKIWDAKTGTCLLTIDKFQEWITSISFSPCGTQIACASYDKSITIWDIQTGNCLLILNNHSGTATAYSVAFSPDGSKVTIGLDDTTICIYTFHTLRKEFTLSTLLFLEYLLFHKNQGTLTPLPCNENYFKFYSWLPQPFQEKIAEAIDLDAFNKYKGSNQH